MKTKITRCQWILATLFLTLIVNIFCLNSDIQKDKNEVVTAAENLLTALSEKDSSAARQVLLSPGQFTSIREDGSVRTRMHQEFLESISREKNQLLETMKNPKVFIQENIAVLWAEYDFYINGEYSHCGIDVFNLVKTKKGWRITGLTYSVVK